MEGSVVECSSMSEILNITHDMARDLLKAGAMDEMTMRKVDALCLLPKQAFRPEDLQRIRLANHVSQAVFAAILGIGKTSVQPIKYFRTFCLNAPDVLAAFPGIAEVGL
jgi:putative transcriptional regulator